MATILPDALSWDQYKNREPLPNARQGRYERPLNDENRHLATPERSADEQDDYAGNDPMQPLPERISIIALTKNNPLTCPHVTSKMDEQTATKTAIQWHQGILEAGGPRALQFMRDAASQGNKAVLAGRELGHGDSLTAVGSHQGVGLATAAFVGTALEMFPATREDAQSGVSRVDASDEESAAKTLARAREQNLTRTGYQKLPTDAKKVDFAAALTAFNSKITMPQEQRIHPESASKLLKDNLVKDEDQNSDTYNKIIALSPKLAGKVNEKYHDAIINQANSPARFGALRVPPSAVKESVRAISQSRAIFCDPQRTEEARNSIANAGRDEEIVIGSRTDALKGTKTAARISTVHYNRSSAKAYENMGYSSDAARYLKNGTQMIDHVDKVDMHLDGKKVNALNGFLLGYAAAQGKVGTITQDGKEISLSQAQAIGAANYMNMAQSVRKSLSQGLNVDMSDPAAAVGMALFTDKEDGKMSNEDILAAQKAQGMTLLDVISQVSTPEGAQQFQTEHRVSAAGIRLLRNEQASANAGRDLTNILNFVSGTGQTIIGPDQMPENLRESGLPFLFVSGDPEALKDTKRLAIVGEPLTGQTENEAKLASQIAPQLAEIDRANIGRTWVEGATPFPMEPKNGDVVFVPRGLGIHRNEQESNAQDERDMAGATTVSAEVPFVEVYKAPKTRGKNAKGTTEEVKNHGSEAADVKAAQAMASLSERMVVTNGKDLGNRTPVKAAVASHLRAGKRVIAVDPGVTEGSPITQTLLTTKGPKALENLAYGPAVTEDKALLASVRGGYAAVSTNSNPERTASQLKSLVENGKLAIQPGKERVKEQDKDAR